MARSAGTDPFSGGKAASERRSAILNQLGSHGRVEVGDLALQLGVAEETVRRDLRALEDGGLLQRAHGGAIRAADAIPDLGALTGADVTPHPLATLAAPLLPDSGIVYLDAGPITEALATFLPDSAAVQVVTNSIPVALIASRNPSLVVYNLGGTVDPVDGSQTGQWTREEISRIRIDVAFLGTAGLTSDGHLTASTPKAAIIKSAAVKAAGTVVLLADTTNLAEGGMVKYAALSDLDVLVTGDGLAGTIAAQAFESAVDVITPSGVAR